MSFELKLNWGFAHIAADVSAYTVLAPLLIRLISLVNTIQLCVKVSEGGDKSNG